MDLIHDHLDSGDPALALPRVALSVSRLDLEKRRWRGAAANGREFGFDLEHPLHHGTAFFTDGAQVYVINQQPEPVLELALGDPEASARLGWKIGNLHFPIQVTATAIRVANDPAIRQMLEREHLAYGAREAVFQPIKGAPHGHHH
jgi:urease accessory protein